MLTRQACWVPVLQHSPTFAEHFHRFICDNPITKMNVEVLGLKPESVKVALEPNPRRPGTSIAAMMAFPLTITPGSCDANLRTSAKEFSFGFATATCDSCNSLHVMERLLPAFNVHVSVSIQSQMVRPLREGERVVVVSTIDKMGKRLVYCKTDFYVDAQPTGPLTVDEATLATPRDLHMALQMYEKVLSSTHVKSIVEEKKK